MLDRRNFLAGAGGVALAAVPHVKVGITLALQDLRPGPGGEALYRTLWDEARAPFYAAVRKDDFIGVQAYNRPRTGPDGYQATAPARHARPRPEQRT